MNPRMNLILQYIASADREDIDLIIEAVIRKCDAAAPEWETVFMSLPREDWTRREEYLKNICKFSWSGKHIDQG